MAKYMMTRRASSSYVFVFIASAWLTAIPAIAYAHAGNADPNMVHACVVNSTHIVRIVGVNGSCAVSPPSKAETAVHWPLVAGTGTRADGPCFDNVNRYVDCGNGTVTDTVTGLVWLKQASCLGSDLSWQSANQAAAGLKDGDCGGTLTDGSSPGDWRLPTRVEWQEMIARAAALNCGGAVDISLTDDAGTGCATTESSSFVGAVPRGFYWSATANEEDPSNAWFVSLLGGLFSMPRGIPPGNTAGAWPVRRGLR